jgi:hypothetical protein
VQVSDGETVRQVAAVRGAWGAVLLLAPGRVGRVWHAPDSWQGRAVLRVLGARHLAQAAVTRSDPSGTVAGLGIAVDVAHALSAVAYAASARHRRRAGLASALGATAFAVAGFLTRPDTEVRRSPAS